MTQSQVRFTPPTGRSSPDGCSTTTSLNYGRGFYGRLPGNREARSLAYSAWGGYGGGAQLGDENRLLGVLGCQTDKTVEAVDLMLKLFADPPATEVRLKETRESILQSYRTDPLTFREVPGAVQSWEDIGFDKDPRPARFKRAQTYSLDEFKTLPRG